MSKKTSKKTRMTRNSDPKKLADDNEGKPGLTTLNPNTEPRI